MGLPGDASGHEKELGKAVHEHHQNGIWKTTRQQKGNRQYEQSPCRWRGGRSTDREQAKTSRVRAHVRANHASHKQCVMCHHVLTYWTKESHVHARVFANKKNMRFISGQDMQFKGGCWMPCKEENTQQCLKKYAKGETSTVARKDKPVTPSVGFQRPLG